MNTHDIELPAEFRSGNDIPVTVATIKRERMEEILRAAIEAYRKRRYEEAEVDTPTPEDMLSYVMYIAHERELRIGGHKHDEPNAIERFNAAVQRLIDGHSQRRGEPVDWKDGYRAAMNEAGWAVRELYVNHVHHTGVDGLLKRCQELEQSFIRSAEAAPQPAEAVKALIESQEPLGEEFQKVLEENQWDLYIKSAEPVKAEALTADHPVIKFLLGEGELRGVHYGERHPDEKGAYWWRKDLRAALAEPVKAPSDEDIFNLVRDFDDADVKRLPLMAAGRLVRAAFANYVQPTEPVKKVSDAAQRDATGETWMGMRVAAWEWNENTPLGELPHHATHWSTGPANAERLYRERDIRALLARYGQPAQPTASPDRAMLLALMEAFDNEVWECGNCTFTDPAKDCDSAIMLRDYLKSNSTPVAAQPSAHLPMGLRAVAAELLACFKAWEPGVRVLGNVQAKDGADLMQAILAPTPPAAEPPTLEEEEAWQQIEKRNE